MTQDRKEPRMSTEDEKVVGPPPGTNGAGGPGRIPKQYRDATVGPDTDRPEKNDEAHK